MRIANLASTDGNDFEFLVVETAKQLAQAGFVELASLPKKLSITSVSKPTLPTAMTRASVIDLVQPAIPQSDPFHSGIQK